MSPMILMLSALFGAYVTKFLEIICERKLFTKLYVEKIFLFGFFKLVDQ